MQCSVMNFGFGAIFWTDASHSDGLSRRVQEVLSGGTVLALELITEMHAQENSRLLDSRDGLTADDDQTN